jgi:hypothetical protein
VAVSNFFLSALLQSIAEVRRRRSGATFCRNLLIAEKNAFADMQLRSNISLTNCGYADAKVSLSSGGKAIADIFKKLRVLASAFL